MRHPTTESTNNTNPFRALLQQETESLSKSPRDNKISEKQFNTTLKSRFRKLLIETGISTRGMTSWNYLKHMCLLELTSMLVPQQAMKRRLMRKVLHSCVIWLPKPFSIIHMMAKSIPLKSGKQSLSSLQENPLLQTRSTNMSLGWHFTIFTVTSYPLEMVSRCM
jgi:hypothetical protein